MAIHIINQHYYLLGRTQELDIYGDGSDGDLNITSSDVYLTCANPYDVIVKNYRSINIQNGHKLIVNSRNAGLVIRCLGNCTIANDSSTGIWNRYGCGKLTTTQENAIKQYYPRTQQSSLCGNGGNGSNGEDSYIKDSSYWQDGGSGGTGMTGTWYSGGYSGGGGGAGSIWGSTGGSGDSGGNGGSATNIYASTTSLFIGGGQYGDGTNGGGGGSYYDANDGAGVVGHDATDGSNVARGGSGGNGTYGAGVILMFIKGNTTMGHTLNVNVQGSDGGSGGMYKEGGSGSLTRYAGAGGSGGGGGGGKIYIVHKGTISHSLMATTSCRYGQGGGSTEIPKASNGTNGVLTVYTEDEYRQYEL